MFNLLYTTQAKKDAKKIHTSHLRNKVEQLLEVLKEDAFQNPPSFEELVGDLKGVYSRRINIRHRLVYEVLENQMIVKILSMWDHYE